MYLRRIVIIISMVVGLAFLSGKLMDDVYKKRWNILWFEKTNELVHSKTSYDIIFLGNSRVHFGINPFYVDAATRLSSYNFGTGGADAEEMLLITDTYLARHPAPKLAVISLDPGILFDSHILKTRYHYLFYLQDKNVNNSMYKAGFQTGLIRFLPFLKYSFFDEYNRTSLFVKGKAYPSFDHNQYKGFLNVHQTLENKESRVYNRIEGPLTISTVSIEKFEQMVAAFREHGSQVIFVYPPLRSNARNKQTDIEMEANSVFNALAARYNLPTFHFENDALYVDAYFVDDIHFNEPGTRIYSRALGDSISRQLNNQNRSRPTPVEN